MKRQVEGATATMVLNARTGPGGTLHVVSITEHVQVNLEKETSIDMKLN